MSQVRDIELEVALDVEGEVYSYENNNEKHPHSYDFICDSIFDFHLSKCHAEALLIDARYVVLARYDENQYSSPPNMRIFGIFSSMDKAKDTMAVWAINRGLGNEMLATCTYDWVLIDGVMV